jgi:hypothetical protein
MSGRTKTADHKVDRLMEEASAALSAMKYAEAERLSLEALHEAHQAEDYERMGRIVLPLQEARRQRRQQAAEVKKLSRIKEYEDLESLLTGQKAIKRGCYLLEPPLVGADGRELRERSLAEGVSVFVVVREPQTRMGEWPIVAVGPVTVRTRIPPPKKVDVGWILRAGEALGDAAIGRIDPHDSAAGRVEHYLEFLSAFPDHEKLHEGLLLACHEAHHDAVTHPKKRGRPKQDDDDFPEEDPDEF